MGVTFERYILNRKDITDENKDVFRGWLADYHSAHHGGSLDKISENEIEVEIEILEQIKIDEADKIKKKYDELIKERDRLTGCDDEIQKYWTLLRTNYDEESDRRVKAESDFMLLSKKLEDAVESWEDTVQQKDELEMKLKTMKASLDVLHEEKEDLSLRNDSVYGTIKTLRIELDERNRNSPLPHVESSVADDNIYTRKGSASEPPRTGNEAVNADKSTSTRQSRNTNAEIEKLKVILKYIQEEKHELILMNDELHERLKPLENEQHVFETYKRELRQNTCESTHAVSDSETDERDTTLQDIIEQHKSMTREIESLKARLKEIYKEKHELFLKNDGLIDTLKTIRSELEVLSARADVESDKHFSRLNELDLKLVAVSEERDELVSKNEEVNEKLKEVCLLNKECVTKNETIEGEVAKLRSGNKELKGCVRGLQNTLNERDKAEEFLLCEAKRRNEEHKTTLKSIGDVIDMMFQELDRLKKPKSKLIGKGKKTQKSEALAALETKLKEIRSLCDGKVDENDSVVTLSDSVTSDKIFVEQHFSSDKIFVT